MSSAISDQGSIVELVLDSIDRGADEPSRAALLAAGAPQAAVGLLEGEHADSRIPAAQCLAAWVKTSCGDFLGAAAIHRHIANQLLKCPGADRLWSSTLANVLTAYCAEAVDSGLNAEMLSEAPRWIELMSFHGRQDAAVEIRLCCAEALLNQ